MQTTIATYIIVWIVLFIKKSEFRLLSLLIHEQCAAYIDRRVLYSVTVTTFLVISGWLTVSVVLVVAMSVYKANEQQMLILHGYIGNLINVSMALQYPVYYVFCLDFRVAFKGKQASGSGYQPTFQSNGVYSLAGKPPNDLVTAIVRLRLGHSHIKKLLLRLMR